MGMTIGCARCHNHKFDPISIHDYYSMSAVFQDVEFGSRYPELDDDHPRVVREKRAPQRTRITSPSDAIEGLGVGGGLDGLSRSSFSTETVEALRVSFDGRWVMMDELEILESGDHQRNGLSSESRFRDLGQSSDAVISQPTANLINGVFGAKDWPGQSQRESGKTVASVRFPGAVTVEPTSSQFQPRRFS